MFVSLFKTQDLAIAETVPIKQFILAIPLVFLIYVELTVS